MFSTREPAAEPRQKRTARSYPAYGRFHYAAPAPSQSYRQWRPMQRETPSPASIGVSVLRRDTQRPCGLIRTHHICSEPRHLCRFIRVRDISIPAFRSLRFSGAPRVASGLQDILFLNGGVPRPQPPRRQSRLFQESLQCQSACAGEPLSQRMKGGPTIARGPMPVVKEPQRIGNEFQRR